MNIKRMKLVLKTLDQIDVRGKENLDLMLGCMMALEKEIAEEEKRNAESNKGNVSDAEAGAAAE